MRISKNIKSLFYFIIALIFLVSCSSHPVKVQETEEKPVCTAPCWENITPGITTRDDLTQMLHNRQDIFDMEFGSNSIPWGETISWCQGGTGCGSIGSMKAFSAFDENGIVQEVYIYSGGLKKLKDFKMEYGDPKQLIFSDYPSPDTAFASIDLLYPDIGLGITIVGENKGTFTSPQMSVQEDSDIVNVYYTTPGLDYYFSHNVERNPIQLCNGKDIQIIPKN